MEVFPAELRAELWDVEARPALRSSCPSPDRGIAGLQLVDVATYLPGDLLPKADIASMAHSLELRSPLLDHEVLALGLALPDGLKLKGREGKQALRRAFADLLPPEVAGPRQGGLRRPAREPGSAASCATSPATCCSSTTASSAATAVERLLAEHADGSADHGHRLWCLVMLALWQNGLDARLV